jgi:hypothetical protein
MIVSTRSVKRTASALLIAALAAVQAPVNAAAGLTLRLVSSSGTVIEVSDNGPGDAYPDVGIVTYIGAFENFSSIVVTGTSKPLVGDATTAHFDVTGVTVSTGGHTLTAFLTDTGFTGNAGTTTLQSAIGGTTRGSTTLQTFVDTNNASFGTAGPGVCTTGLQGPLGPGAFDNTATGNCTLTGAFSMTMVVATALPAGGVQSFGAHSTVGIPVAPIGCRFTGGGVDTSLNWNHVLEEGEMARNGANDIPAGIDRYQFGGQVGARTASQPQPSGEWQHHQQTGPTGSFSFHGGTRSAAPGTRIVDVRCSDPGFCEQARPAPAKQLDFSGIGTFSNVGKGTKAPVFHSPGANVIPEPQGKGVKPFTFHWFEVNIDDLGEPGGFNGGAPDPVACPGRGFGEKSGGPFPDPDAGAGAIVILPPTELGNCDCPDFYRITIYQGVSSTNVTYLPDGKIDPTSLDRTKVIYEVYGYIDGGNLQIHPPTGFDQK